MISELEKTNPDKNQKKKRSSTLYCNGCTNRLLVVLIYSRWCLFFQKEKVAESLAIFLLINKNYRGPFHWQILFLAISDLVWTISHFINQDISLFFPQVFFFNFLEVKECVLPTEAKMGKHSHYGACSSVCCFE